MTYLLFGVLLLGVGAMSVRWLTRHQERDLLGWLQVSLQPWIFAVAAVVGGVVATILGVVAIVR